MRLGQADQATVFVEGAGQDHAPEVDAIDIVADRLLAQKGMKAGVAVVGLKGQQVRRDGRQIGRSVNLVQRQEGRKVVVWPPDQAEAPLRYPF